MNHEKSSEENISIVALKELESSLIAGFYEQTFRERKNVLPQIYQWLYRMSDSYKPGPLVVLENNKIVGHLGVIPFEIEMEGKVYQANCPVDLILLPEFRKKGIGLKLVERLMENSEVSLGMRANEISKNALTKLGYEKSDQTYFHTFFIKPFNYPTISKKLPAWLRDIFNRIVYPFLYINYKRHSFQLNQVVNKVPDKDSLSGFERILEKERMKEGNNIISVLRDLKYLTWRILDSPDREKYRILELNNFTAIIKLSNGFIDILSVSGRKDFQLIRGLISGLAIWGNNNGYSYIRFYTSEKHLSTFLKKSLLSFVTNPIFLFYARNPELMDKTRQSNWNLELIDSDFERFH